jgi:hypothetical protein
LEMESILKELEQNRGYFPREAIEEAIRRREEITPHLMRALKEAVDLYAKTLADDTLRRRTALAGIHATGGGRRDALVGVFQPPKRVPSQAG